MKILEMVNVRLYNPKSQCINEVALSFLLKYDKNNLKLLIHGKVSDLQGYSRQLLCPQYFNYLLTENTARFDYIHATVLKKVKTPEKLPSKK